MPELDGWKVLEVVQQIKPSPRVVIITAYGREDSEKTAKDKGAWAYVEKPYIVDKIRELLKKEVL